jgi:hypothetical protein
MTQVSSIVRRALILLGVQDATEAVSAQEMQDGIDALNDMVTLWEGDGISLGWTNVSGPTDTLPAPPEANFPIIFNLAVALRPNYKVPLEADVIQQATDGLASLRAAVIANTYSRISYADLPMGEGWCGGYNFNNG